jgi:hypothetical protein
MPLALAAMPPETPEQTAHWVDYINQRWAQLNSLEKDWLEKAVKYLFLTNSGGVVTVLSFIGTSEKAHAAIGSKFALGLFVIGLILVGFFKAWHYRRIANIFASWRIDSENYFSDRMTWELLIENDNNRSRVSVVTYILGYASFAAFIVGCIFGLINLFK